MSNIDILERFVLAQESTYNQALIEIKNGKKETHWIWFIFPTIANRFAATDYNIKYAITNLEEAIQYYKHPILGKRLIEITTELYKLQEKTIEDIFPKPDIKKVKSCMTLFSLVPNSNPVFKSVLDKFYNGETDVLTIGFLKVE